MCSVASIVSATASDLITGANSRPLFNLATFSGGGLGIKFAGVLSGVLTISRSLALGWFQLRPPIFAFGNFQVLFLSYEIDDKSNGAQLK